MTPSRLLQHGADTAAPPPSPRADARGVATAPAALEEIAALLTAGRAATTSAAEARPKLKVSASGRFQDQFYHAHEGSRTIGLLRNRAYNRSNKDKATRDVGDPGGTRASLDPGPRESLSESSTRARRSSSAAHGREAVEQFSDSDIVFAGYLIKQGSFWKTWRRRYFILRRDIPVLAYYASKENLVKLGEITIDGTTRAYASKTEAFPFRFIVEHGNRKLVLVVDPGKATGSESAGQTQSDVDLWLRMLNNCIRHRDNERKLSMSDRSSFTRASLDLRLSTNGSQLAGDSTEWSAVSLPATLPSMTASPHANKVKRHSTDSRVIQAAADAAVANRLAEDAERNRFVRRSQLQSMGSTDATTDVAPPAKPTPSGGAGSVAIMARPRLFRSYSAGSVLSKRSSAFDATRAHDDCGLQLLERTNHSSNKQLGIPTSTQETRARNLSLPGFRPGPTVELSISVGSKSAFDFSQMVVSLSSAVSGHDTTEIARTEVQNTLSLRPCGGDFYVRDFSALLSVPITSRNVLHFEIYAVVNSNSEVLSSQLSIGFVRISPLDLLFSRDSTIVLECRRSRFSPARHAHFLVIDRIVPSESLNLGHSYTYAKRHFVADIVPLDMRKTSSPDRLGMLASSCGTDESVTRESMSGDGVLAARDTALPPPPLSYQSIPRGPVDSSETNQVFISEELSSSYCSVSVAAAYTTMLQTRNQRRIYDTKLFISEIEKKYKDAPSSPCSKTEEVDIAALHNEMLRDAETQILHYTRLHEVYAACSDYYVALETMLEEGKEPGITGCLKRSTQKKDKLTEFMPTNLNCHLIRARRVALAGLSSSTPAKDTGTRDHGATADELVYGVITHGCPAAHCMGFKEGGLRKLQNQYAIAKNDQRLLERIEQRQDIVRCQVLAIAAAAFLSVIGLAANHSARHQERLQLMCQTGFLLNIESLLSTIKSEKGMIEDMAEGVTWANSALSFQVVQSVEVDPKLKCAKCVGVTSSESGDHVVATFALPPEVYTSLPIVLQQGHALKVHAVVFTQGINEMQSVANTMLDTSLQDEINYESAERLRKFFEVYKTHVLAMESTTGAPSARQSGLLNLETEVKILVEKLHQARRSNVQKKNVNLLIESSDLCRRLGAGRTTCCKSGKDRTAMSVTLECSRLLVDTFHVKQGVHLCNAMRERGVRRVNVLANTGKNKFAFNSLQLKYLPDCYRPPALTADSRVAS